MLMTVMAVLVPCIAIAGVFITKRTDEVDSFCMRFGIVALVGAIVGVVTHLAIPFVASAAISGAGLLCYFFVLRQQQAA
jgi:hypothetical protein